MRLLDCAPFFFALTAVTTSAIAGPPALARPIQRSQAETPPPPPAKGWPHSILTANGSTPCARAPQPNEVIAYNENGFKGGCASFVAGFYPQPANLVIGDNKMHSLKVGAAVRARLFRDPNYAGGWSIYKPGANMASLDEFNGNGVSSARIEPGSRSDACSDLQEGEISLFEHAMHGDCVVLPGTENYANAASMGIANDSITATMNQSALTLRAFYDPNFSGRYADVRPHSGVTNWGTGDTANDKISSIMMIQK